jgi:hypothetical protein
MGDKFRENPVIGEVGIFWIWGNQLIQNSVPWSDTKWFEVGREQFYDFPVDHCTYWERLKKHVLNIVDLEYDEVPRGRVVYNKTSRVFYVYGPKSYINKKKVQSLIKDGFSLAGKKVIFKEDSHY